MSQVQNTVQLTEYEIHDVLRNERRRWVLEHLQEKREPVPLRDLSEQLAALETGETPPPRNIRESVYNALHQTHLPKLDDMQIIEYDCDRKLVALDDGSQQVNLYMEAVSDDGVTWATYYLAVGLTALVVIALSSAGIVVFTMISVLVWAGLFFCLLIISVLYQKLRFDGAYIDLN
jgi:hypothetical protein